MTFLSRFAARLLAKSSWDTLVNRVVLQCEHRVWDRMDERLMPADPAGVRGYFRARAQRVVQRAVAADPQAAAYAQQLVSPAMDRLLATWIQQRPASPAQIVREAA